jgi:kinesin family member C1
MYKFDRVFGPEASQSDVFLEVGDFVQSALDGHNVCLLSYGQTGSGKSYTIQGRGQGRDRGLIPRVMEQVGKYHSAMRDIGWEYSMHISFIEIMDEQIIDVMSSADGMDEVDTRHEISLDEDGNAYVTGVTIIPVDPNDSAQVLYVV